MTIEHSRLNIGSFQTTVRPDDPVVRDHRVRGVPVLPGVALLDAVMRAAELSGVDPATAELGNVLFESAVTVPDSAAGRRLVFRSSDRDDGVQVVVRAKFAEPGADDDEERQCAECLLRPADESRSPAELDVAAVRQALDSGAGSPIDDRYSALRALGIEHGEFMRARGTVLAHGDRLVAELVLADGADRRRDDFFVPPTFLDAAIVATLTDALTEAGHLFLPVYIGSFRAWKRPGNRVYAATRPGGAVRRGDAVETDVWLYDADGSVVAELLRFTAMRTSADHLGRPPASPPTTPASPPTPPAEATARATAQVTARPAAPPSSRRLRIAIVGLSGRYPGACDIDELWDNLEAGREAIGPVPAQRWDPAEYETATRKLSRFGGFLTDVDKFDPLFFRIPPTGAELLDPQERLFLEAAYGAIENAGYQPFGFAPPDNRIGVFVGASWTDYRLITAEAARNPGTPTAVSGLSAIANRVSYTLNLTGPSMVVDTACSASLTALHVACRSLADGDCDAVIVGGVNLLLHPEKFLIYSQMNLVSSDGRVRSFGAGGDGHVPGEGVGALFLKPLDRAVADGDTVHGVILATAVNHGGQAAGFTVPRPDAQAEVIGRALAEAEIDPDSIGYVEAHGTGTALGDPVEMAGLARAYAGRAKPLAVGSVKSNVGHLESAAGVIGVTRALLQFRHGRITPSLHSEVLNPDIDIESTPFYVPQRVEQWPSPIVDGTEQPRRSAISSFGAGGSNAHVVIEEYLAAPAAPDSGDPELIVLSARSTKLLSEYALRIAGYLRQAGDHRLADVARTLQVGRPALEARLGFPASSPQEASAILERFAAGDSGPVCVGVAASQPDPAGPAELSRRYKAGDLAGAALLWSNGVTPDWTELNGGPQRRIPMPGYPFERRRFWIGERGGQPGPTSAGPGLLASARRDFEATLEPVADRLERAFPAMGQYAADALLRRLRELGILPGVISRTELSQRLGVIPAYERFVDAFLAVLERHGGLRRQDDRIELLGGTANPLTREEVLAWFGDAEPIIRFADTCLRAYPEILSGRTPATEVLFADASMDLMAGVYRGNRVYDFYSELGGRFVACAAASASQRGNRPVRVLEVGAGTGAASHPALAALAAGGQPVEYYYTDVGGSFVAHGRATFGPGYPFARFQRFDMEQDPRGQGYDPASMDVILAAGVLHAAADIDATLARLRGLLVPGGVLVACEAVEDHDIMAVAAGLFAGWTSYRDAERRIANSPLLTEAGWAAAFARSGYEGFTAYGPGLTGDTCPGHRTMVAARPDDGPAAVAAGVPATTEHLSGRKLGAGPGAVAGSTPGAGQSSRAATAQEPPDDDEAAELCEPVVAEIVARRLGIESREIRRDRSFAEFGVDSILAVAIVGEINEAFGLSMKPTVLFDYPSVRDLSDLLASEGGRPPAIPAGPAAEPAGLPAELAGLPAEPAAPVPARTPARASAGATAAHPLDIAVIGMAGRYPDADDYRALWRNLAAGHDSVTEVPPNRWYLGACYQPGPPAPGKIYSRWGAYLADVDRFDPLFFGISPGEADFMDPQQRLFLEESWRAIEDAGMDPRRLKGVRCGVFAGAPPSDYMSLIRDAGLIGAYGSFTGNSPAILPARIAYHLDLVGPCVAVDTACSSSLVAIYQACRSLTDGECDLALAGGVAAFATPEHLVLSSSVGMLSPTGRCRPFDADADGLALGEGVGVVLLKPLARALADGDPVHGVIKGIGVNQDGHTNGITAPSARSQAALALDVYRRFGIDPAAIGYIETHGTGTALGDPIEVEALTSVFRQFTERRQFIPIGSIKSNIGHSSHAAGVAGLIKVLLAMRAGQLPPTLHFKTPNPLIAFEETPFFVGTDLRTWNGGPRTAAVSSFGFSGTNCHLVVEAHDDARRPTARPDRRTLVPLSAQTGDGLRRQAAELVRFLADRPDPDRLDPDLHDLAATLATGRAVFEHRLAVIAESASELCDRLSLAADGRTGAGIFLGCSESDEPRHARGVVPGAGLEATAQSWVTGEMTSLYGLYPDGRPRRIIHLPGYAFARDRCWVPGSEADSPEAGPGAGHQPAIPAGSAGVDESGLVPRAQEYLKRIFAAEARLPAERIKPRTPLEDYGIESILITQLTRRLELDFGDLPSTLFFEYQTLGELAGYFASEHAERLAAVTGPATPSTSVSLPPPAAQVQRSARREPAGSASRRSADVAVIGMSGRFPLAESVEELWRNLVAGRDCITEIPADRWDHVPYLSEDPEEPGTTYARWGGFIDGVDRFDARFFGISPKDAEAMDPQQRLFLEAAWAAMEDAGYTPQRARRTARRRGTKDVGVFVGVTYGEYQLLVDIPIAGYWAVANRVSYHLGFNGPSLAVDTACSSSLTAVHLALESLRRGECGYALAGGVNVTIHPGKFLLLGLGGWASSDGRCRTFGAGGDGYVPGEGVAALLLKPLDDAIADGDRIYGVIRASASNQDGRTNGFTVPSPVAQAELVHEAMTDAAIDPRSVSYVEAHGTGTSLGDPIEIAALTKAFRGFTADQGFCAIGSAKSSIGHLEAAAGVAGLVKVLLQLRHDMIAPTLHAQPPNPNIDFAKSPFRVALTGEPWRRDPNGTPRVAAVSSFGAGGSNAHVIITDPPPAPARAEGADGADQAERLVVLSARRRDQLEEQARSLARFLRSECGRQTRLADVAWTLMVGRESFEHRLALVGLSHADLAARLEEFADNGAAPDGLTGTVGAHETTGGEAPAEVEQLRDLVTGADLRGLGRLWTQGWSVDWEALAGPACALAAGQIVSLPTYPFARDRYWIVPADYRRRDQHHGSPAPPAATAPAAAPTPAPAPSGDQDELEQRITEIFSDLTKMPADQMDVHADFLDFGFDSIITVRMLNRLMKAYGVQLPGTAIEEYTTIRSLASYLIEAELITAGTGGAAARAVDPRIARVIAAPARQPERLVRSEPFGIESIFITGVTGVLGGKLLYDLLSDTTVLVTCLVRGQDEVKALDRVRYFLAVYDVEERLREEFDRRVSVVLGDVSQSQLGLDDDTISKLAATTDLTIHAAARTTLVTFYDALAPVNVDGTRRAIDFALRTKHKYLVYVSSFSVVGDWQIYDHPPFKESDIELGQGYEHLPYQETKYHSEKLIRAATDEGLVWNIFRPGNIMGEGRTGRYPFAEVTVKGVFYDIFKTVAETGIAMLSPNHWDVSPVDYVSAGLLHLALRRPSYRETYHLTNPDVRSMYELFRLIGDFGYPVRPISIDMFHKYATERLFRKAATGEPYESATIEVLKYGIEIWGREHYERSTAPDATYTSSILRSAGIECPAIAELIPRYLSHCIEIGYLDPPPRTGGGGRGGGENGPTDAVVFPGQGAQKRGMAADYHAKFAIARQTFEEASDAIGEDVARICFDEDERLRRTEFTQPCLLTAEVAAYRVAALELGLSARLFGGHSVGEYTALVASGAITLPDAVRLVRRRGELMQRAVPEGEGGMAALIHEDIEATGALGVIRALGAEIANLNSPHQVAISGSAGCLEEVRRVLAEAVPDLDYVALKVSAPFHSRLMLPAEHDFEPYLRECAERFRPERAAVVTSNLTGDFHDPAALADNLLRQISQPVRWQDNMRALTGRADRIFEIGPRGSLTKFFRAIDYSVIPITTMDEALDQLKATRRMP